MLIEGQPVEIQGSGKNPYVLKNIGGTFSCSCPAWANQSAKIDKRTCKHLKKLLGEESELARVGGDKAADVLLHATGRKLRADEKAKISGPPILLAHPYTPDVDPTGWWVSEKLDGCRAFWDGAQFISRQGNVYQAPDWFKDGLPAHPLDGELWVGRKQFQKTISIVKRADAGEQWRAVKYVIYDAPDYMTPFEQRMMSLEALATQLGRYAAVLAQEVCPSREWLKQKLAAAVDLGCEGLMLRQPGSLYEAKRSHSLLKVKQFHDAEAVVIGYSAGKARHKGRVGALEVQMPDGKTFLIGTGFSDKERESPPAIGTVVTYSYTELTDGGVPKCAAFVRIRESE